MASELATQPLKLTVLKAGAPSEPSSIPATRSHFMNGPAEQQVYVGEVLVGQLLLFLRDDVQNFGNFQPPRRRRRIFHRQTCRAAGRQQQVGNRAYIVFPISVAMTATKAGS